MAAINFPSNPGVNDTHSHNGIFWIWNGTYWASFINTQTEVARQIPGGPFINETIYS